MPKPCVSVKLIDALFQCILLSAWCTYSMAWTRKFLSLMRVMYRVVDIYFCLPSTSMLSTANRNFTLRLVLTIVTHEWWFAVRVSADSNDYNFYCTDWVDWTLQKICSTSDKWNGILILQFLLQSPRPEVPDTMVSHQSNRSNVKHQ